MEIDLASATQEGTKEKEKTAIECNELEKQKVLVNYLKVSLLSFWYEICKSYYTQYKSQFTGLSGFCCRKFAVVFENLN